MGSRTCWVVGLLNIHLLSPYRYLGLRLDGGRTGEKGLIVLLLRYGRVGTEGETDLTGSTMTRWERCVSE